MTMIRSVAAWAAMVAVVAGLALLAIHWSGMMGDVHAAQVCSTTMDPAAPIICQDGPVIVTTTIVYPPAKSYRRRSR
jgi:hypothetical protein